MKSHNDNIENINSFSVLLNEIIFKKDNMSMQHEAQDDYHMFLSGCDGLVDIYSILPKVYCEEEEDEEEEMGDEKEKNENEKEKRKNDKKPLTTALRPTPRSAAALRGKLIGGAA